MRALEELPKSLLYKIYLDEHEQEILDTAVYATGVLPDSVQSFFGREQMMGKLAQLHKSFDFFGNLRGELMQRKQQLEQQEHE